MNPSGKIPFSFPNKPEDNGVLSFGTLSYPGDGTNEYSKEDILGGYRWFDTKHIAPQFAFGFGHSYTTFIYGKIATYTKGYTADETIKVSFTLKSTGKVYGA